MDENKNIWNKTPMELTVKDQLVLSVVAPVIVMGAVAAGATALGVASNIKSKVQAKFNKPQTDIEVK